MSIGQMLRDSYEVAKQHPLIFVPLLAASVLGVVLSLIFVGSAVPTLGAFATDPTAATVEEMATGIGAFIGGAFIVSVVSGIVALIAHGMTVTMADLALKGEGPTLKGAWVRLRTRIVPVIIASLLMGLIIGFATLLLVLPGIVAAFLLMFTLVSVMVDHNNAFQAIKVSVTTVIRNLGATVVFFLVVFAITILGGIAGSILGAIPILGALLTMVAAAIVTGYITILLVRLYQNLEENPTAAPEAEL